MLLCQQQVGEKSDGGSPCTSSVFLMITPSNVYGLTLTKSMVSIFKYDRNLIKGCLTLGCVFPRPGRLAARESSLNLLPTFWNDFVPQTVAGFDGRSGGGCNSWVPKAERADSQRMPDRARRPSDTAATQKRGRPHTTRTTHQFVTAPQC